MARPTRVTNRVQEHRTRRGWSQDELARQSGLSRAGISAIEMNRLVPSTAAALALAAAFGCQVEDLFQIPPPTQLEPAWAWLPDREPCRYWRAEIGGRSRFYPVEATALGIIPHDGIFAAGAPSDREPGLAASTLVMACCDPAVGLLAAELARRAGVRLIVLPRSSREALALLGQGLVHAAGVHLARAEQPEGNAAAVRAQLGGGYQLLRVAQWEEGITFSSGLRLRSVRAALRSNLRWVGREPGSGARQCLDEILGAKRPPRRQATDHRGVAEAIRSGWADLGVCLRLVSEEARLGFLAVRRERYDICFPAPWKHDPRLQALLDVVRTPLFRHALGELPGYDSAETGELETVG